jgi:hypothetical protein
LLAVTGRNDASSASGHPVKQTLLRCFRRRHLAENDGGRRVFLQVVLAVLRGAVAGVFRAGAEHFLGR